MKIDSEKLKEYIYEKWFWAYENNEKGEKVIDCKKLLQKIKKLEEDIK